MTKSSKIYIYCDGGFGNRFLGLISGIVLAHSIKKEPVIIWSANNWCSILFDEVFESALRVERMVDLGDLEGRKDLTRILHQNFFSDNSFWVKSKRPLFFLRALCFAFDSDVFYTTNRLERYARNPLNSKVLPGHLNFLVYYQLKAHEVIKKYVNTADKFYGLHVRQTDFPGALPVEIYLEIVRLHPDKLFFVCSDDEKVELLFSNLKNVFFHEKSEYVNKLRAGDWDSVVVDSRGNEFPFNVNRSSQSVKDAIVDLIILSSGDLSLNPTNNSKFLDSARFLSAHSLLFVKY